MESLTIQDARRKFPFLKTDIYLDTASASLSFEGIEKAEAQFYTEHKKEGIIRRQDWKDMASKCKQRLAELINANSSEIIFLSSTSEGLNIVANIIDWREGDEIIIADNEFPGNIYPWTNLKKRGVLTKQVKNIDGNLPIDLYINAITPKTKLISFSHINWVSGYKINLDEMYDVCRKRNILLCVDACQSLCAVPINTRFLDFLSTSVFKWPLGPFGLSILFVNERVADIFEPNYVSYASVTNELEIRFNDPEFKEGSQKFQYAHINYPATYALTEALVLFNKIGMEKVYNYIFQLTKFLMNGLNELGIFNATPKEDKHRGGIVSFAVKKPKEMVKILKDEKVHVSLRENRIRVSPHFYNNKSDIFRLLEILKLDKNKITKKGVD